ncbi:hypothetical protein WN943_024375 [Citrus x changshan-huyou]
MAKYEIEKFNRNNFSLWKMKMNVILRNNNCLAVIEERPMEITDDDKWNEMDGNAIVDLHLAFTDGSLPDSYDYLIINLMNNNQVDRLVFNDVAASILNEKSRHKNKEDIQVSSQQSEALSVTRERSTERGPSESHNHGRSKSRNKKNVKCYNCASQHVDTKVARTRTNSIGWPLSGRPNQLTIFFNLINLNFNANKTTTISINAGSTVSCNKPRAIGSNGTVTELQRNSTNWTVVVDEIVKMEKKIFPKHESLARSFDEDLKKKNSDLLYIQIHGQVVGYVMYAWPTSLSASITKLAGPISLSPLLKFPLHARNLNCLIKVLKEILWNTFETDFKFFHHCSRATNLNGTVHFGFCKLNSDYMIAAFDLQKISSNS